MSSFSYNKNQANWTSITHVITVLVKAVIFTKDVFLVYGGQEEELVLSGYTDAGFQSDHDDFRSQSGFVFCLNGGVVSWRSSKQDTIADSTIETEYIAASDAAKEAVWLKKFITGLDVIPSIANLVPTYCDNNGAIAQAKEPRYLDDITSFER